jgi:hypothetical protein
MPAQPIKGPEINRAAWAFVYLEHYMRYPYLSVDSVRKAARLAADSDVSVEARKKGGFTYEYIKVGGSLGLSKTYKARRAAYLARATDNGKPRHPLINPNDGYLTRYGLSLLCWAYSPQADKTRAALNKELRHWYNR